MPTKESQTTANMWEPVISGQNKNIRNDSQNDLRNFSHFVSIYTYQRVWLISITFLTEISFYFNEKLLHHLLTK